MGQQRGMFDVDERLRELSAKGDALERLSELMDFEVFRPELDRRCLARTGRRVIPRPPAISQDLTDPQQSVSIK